MAIEDKERWNTKYQNKQTPHLPTEIVKEYASFSSGKVALDIACGLGRHSKYLAKQGFKVDALDISSVAISKLQNIENITAIEVDFDTYTLQKKKYDLIVCTYYLERKIFSQMIDALKPSGILIMETFIQHAINEREPSNPLFMLHSGELESFFKKRCEILHIKEWIDNDYQGFKTMKTSMVARKKRE